MTMQQLGKVTLENEMDLILAHKRSMKLAELAGLSLAQQTSFATAVSEVARNTIEGDKKGCLILGVEADARSRFIVARLEDEQVRDTGTREGLEYAKRLVNKMNVSTTGAQTAVDLFYEIPSNLKTDILLLDEWRRIFRNEPPISAYDELKRKNEQLQDLSEKVQQSELQYRTLTNSLPIIIFAVDLSGQLLYANDWLGRYTGENIHSLNASQWKSVVHPEDHVSFQPLFTSQILQGATALRAQVRLRHTRGQEYLWHQLLLSPMIDDEGKLKSWIGYLVDINTQKIYETTLKDNIELKQAQKQLEENHSKLEEYANELARSNSELQQFAFVASHDLQEPVRKVLFYSDFLLSRYSAVIDEKGRGYFENMRSSAQRMRQLIQDVLTFSQINKEQTRFSQVDLNEILTEALQDLEIAIEEKQAKFNIGKLPVVTGDHRMMRQLFENIINNSLKYSLDGRTPIIDISVETSVNNHEISFRDNGIGFDEQYLPQMFTLFQRLHGRGNYEGTGLGLAICRKIAETHGGSMRASGSEGNGATFFVNLPLSEPVNV